MGGRLATVRSHGEHAFLFNTFSRYGGFDKALWIGLTDELRNDRWVWISGEPATFFNWSPNEPNNDERREMFGGFYDPSGDSQGRWNDWWTRTNYINGAPFQGVVEFSPGATTALISTGAVWRYHDGGADLGTGWRFPAYDDASWPSGPAPLGYGDSDEATVVNGGPSGDRFITTYFRHAFVITNFSSVRDLVVSVLRDDGCVVYLNGAEVFRDNLPAGDIDFTTRAPIPATDGDERWIYHGAWVDKTLLVEGVNWIAVEIHQQAPTSADISFDLQLLAKRANLPPSMSLVQPYAGEVLYTDGTVTILGRGDDDESITNVSYYIDGQFAVNSTNSPFSVTVTNVAEGAHTFHAVATDNLGLSATSAPVPCVIQPQFIARRSVWRFLDTGAAPGPGWRQLSFNDGPWRSGRGEFGYGEGDEQTIVNFGPSETNKFVTTFFRANFFVGDPAAFNSLLLRSVCDDGMIVYVNGQEAWRHNMPAGPVEMSTLANVTVQGRDEFIEAATNLPALFLVAGENIVSVEVHQSARDTSDMSFDMELAGVLAAGEPRLRLWQSATETLLGWDAYRYGYWLEQTKSLTPPVVWERVDVPISRRTYGQFVSLTNRSESAFFRLSR